MEHPVTEMVTGLDIVALQIEVARGRRLPLTQADITPSGHAIECRINAENPLNFTPSPGRITALHLPGGPGVRMDTHVVVGSEVSASYDSMIGKIIAHGKDRTEALARCRSALAEIRVGGISTNASLHIELLDDPGFVAGGVSIHHFEKWLESREARHG